MLDASLMKHLRFILMIFEMIILMLLLETESFSLIPYCFKCFPNGKTQFSELTESYKDMDSNLDGSTVAFYKARMNFNPNAIKLMSKDFISDIYDKENENMVKLND